MGVKAKGIKQGLGVVSSLSLAQLSHAINGFVRHNILNKNTWIQLTANWNSGGK